ncbi:YaaR family protein [Selenomonas ruminantium]|uniref:YaaR family protein n=1 Tax=Selenomonas ruminantium TaxID=971 RepID=UPI0026EB53DE|nr:YaaR family protein [Selenomonas ruminantium]
MPLKVDSRAAQETAFTRVLERDERVESGNRDFSLELMDQEDSLSTEQLDKLLKQIDEQGARLSKTPTYDELKSYRTLIKNFVGEAVNRMYKLHSQAGWDRMGRQKVYTTVRKIDRKLEEMAEKIRLGQSEQLDIIASHDAIRGMLVDLYM